MSVKLLCAVFYLFQLNYILTSLILNIQLNLCITFKYNDFDITLIFIFYIYL